MHPRSAATGSAVVGVFGVIFAAVVFAFGWSAFADDLRQAWRVRSWVQVPATLVEVSGRPRGMGVRYHYVFDGQRHDGTRVGFYDHVSGAEFNALHARNFRTLRAQLEASGPVRSEYAAGRDGVVLRAAGDGAPITIWVNPARPGEAVIDPEVRWQLGLTPVLIVAALFATGLTVAAWGFFGLRSPSEAEGIAAMRTRRPIAGSSRRFPLFGWIAGSGWTAAVAAMALASPPLPGREWLARLAIGAFLTVGLFILWRSALATLRWRRYGRIALELDPYPWQAGSVVSGSLVIPVPYAAGERYDVVLTCTEHGLHGGELRKNNSFARECFREKTQAERRIAPGGTRLRFQIPLPTDAPASQGYLQPIAWTRATADRIYVRWTLTVSGDVAGVDLDETFEVPVERAAPAAVADGAGRSAPASIPNAAGTLRDAMDRAAAASPLRTESGRTPAASASRNPAYVYERRGDRIRVTQPVWNKPTDMTSPSTLVFGVGPSAAFMVIGWFLFSQEGWGPGLIFLGIGTLVVGAYVAYLAHALIVEADEAGVHIERRIFGVPIKRVALARDFIAAVEVTADSPAQRSGSMLTRGVKIRMWDGQSHTVAEFIPHQRDALALRNLLAARLAVASSGSGVVAAPTVPAPRPQPGSSKPWVRSAGIAVILAVAGYQAWPVLRARFGLEPSRPTPPPERIAERRPPPAGDDWMTKFQRAGDAKIQGRTADAVGHYEEARAVIERTRGAGDPLAAVMLERIGDLHTQNRNYAAATEALRKSLAILDGRSHAEVRAEAGRLVLGFDRESVLRQLGWALWELRRYAESLAHYQRAYDTVAELELDERTRNYRLAYSSAGIMAGACTQGDWARAERAMAELKSRMSSLGETDRKWLDYWVRTGEPRLAARKC